ncbi:hypothetical protein BN440_3280 [Erwinia amylovora MR1]|nr:hypothetical protein BN440_3280 [Erwinia amylovora MR1]
MPCLTALCTVSKSLLRQPEVAKRATVQLRLALPPSATTLV